MSENYKMSIITGEVKYSTSELEAIIKQDILSAGFTPQSEIRAKCEFNNGIRLRDQELQHSNVFTLYQKEFNETVRKIALFSAAKDTDDHSNLKEISSLDGVLQIFTNQLYPDHNLELMIPISKCNQWSRHWNFLHIIKKGNMYIAKLYEPKGIVSFQFFYSCRYIENTLRKYFPNCVFQIEHLGQQKDDTICGVCTAENMMSKIRGIPVKINIKKYEDQIRLKHLALYKKEYPQWQESEQSKFVIKKEINDQKKVCIEGGEWDISMESGASKPTTEGTSKNALVENAQGACTNVDGKLLCRDKELIIERKQVEVSHQEQSASTAREYLIEIQKTIFNTKGWQTGLGGEDANFFKSDGELIKSASVPIGIKKILKEIKKVQNNEKNFEEVFVKTQEIARKRLYKPRFSCGLFQVRSDLTTNFYSWVAQLDRKDTIKLLLLSSVKNSLKM